jgi:hypothetical protein
MTAHSLAHIYMTAHFPDLVQALQLKVVCELEFKVLLIILSVACFILHQGFKVQISHCRALITK